MENPTENPTRWKVSTLTRLATVITYSVPLVGAATGAVSLIREMQKLRTSQTAGIETVMAAVNGATLPLSLALYLSVALGLAIVGLVGMRAMRETTTASPPFWFFLLCGIFSLIPAVIFWRAKWLIEQVLTPGSEVAKTMGGPAAVGEHAATLLVLTVLSVPAVALVFCIGFAVPFTSKSKGDASALTGAVLAWLLLMGAALS